MASEREEIHCNPDPGLKEDDCGAEEEQPDSRTVFYVFEEAFDLIHRGVMMKDLQACGVPLS